MRAGSSWLLCVCVQTSSLTLWYYEQFHCSALAVDQPNMPSSWAADSQPADCFIFIAGLGSSSFIVERLWEEGYICEEQSWNTPDVGGAAHLVKQSSNFYWRQVGLRLHYCDSQMGPLDYGLLAVTSSESRSCGSETFIHIFLMFLIKKTLCCSLLEGKSSSRKFSQRVYWFISCVSDSSEQLIICSINPPLPCPPAH